MVLIVTKTQIRMRIRSRKIGNKIEKMQYNQFTLNRIYIYIYVYTLKTLYMNISFKYIVFHTYTHALTHTYTHNLFGRKIESQSNFIVYQLSCIMWGEKNDKREQKKTSKMYIYFLKKTENIRNTC